MALCPTCFNPPPTCECDQRFVDPDPASVARRVVRRRSGVSRSSRQAMLTMRATVDDERLLVEFDDGRSCDWMLPHSRTGEQVRSLSLAAQAWAEAQGATFGQMKAVHKALTEAGYYITAPSRQ